MLISVTSPSGNERDPTYLEQLLQTLHRLEGYAVEFQIRGDQGEALLAIQAESECMPLIRSELGDVYPGLKTRFLKEESQLEHRMSAEIRLIPDVLPIKTFGEVDFSVTSDPLAGLLSVVRGPGAGRLNSRVCLQTIPAEPSSLDRLRRLYRLCQKSTDDPIVQQRLVAGICNPIWYRRLVARLRLRFRSARRNSDTDVSKLNKALFQCRLRIEVGYPAGDEKLAWKQLRTIIASFARYHDTLTRFKPVPRRPTWWYRRGFLLSATEIATLWHPPQQSAESVAHLRQSTFKELPPPKNLPSKRTHPDATTLGRVVFRNQRQSFGITLDDLRLHMLVAGATGCGKSTLLINIARQQMEMNRGTVVICPHGQLIEDLLPLIPKHRKNDVVYLDAANRSATLGYNPLVNPYSDATLVADAVVTAFSNVFGFDAGSAPRLLHIFRNCLLTLIGRSDASLLTVQRLLTDHNYRQSIIPTIEDEVVRSFWTTEFNRWSDRDRTQYIASLQNKLSAFLTNKQLRTILCPKKSINLREVIDAGQILLCNLSKGTIGHEASKLMGSLIMAGLQTSALSRADIAESTRRDSVIIVDEFHAFLTEGNETFASVLSESRKYRTSYVLATQYLSQLDSATHASVLANCGALLCMRLGSVDAGRLAPVLHSDLSQPDLMQCPQYRGYIRTLINGSPATFSLATQPVCY